MMDLDLRGWEIISCVSIVLIIMCDRRGGMRSPDSTIRMVEGSSQALKTYIPPTHSALVVVVV